MRKQLLTLLFAAGLISAVAQTGFPVNGVADPRIGVYAFTNATIVKDPQTTVQNAILLIRDGKIVSVGAGIAIPKDAIVVDCKGKYIYPSFIDMYSDYGTPVVPPPVRISLGGPSQPTSNQKE